MPPGTGWSPASSPRSSFRRWPPESSSGRSSRCASAMQRTRRASWRTPLPTISPSASIASLSVSYALATLVRQGRGRSTISETLAEEMIQVTVASRPCNWRLAGQFRRWCRSRATNR